MNTFVRLFGRSGYAKTSHMWRPLVPKPPQSGALGRWD